MCCVLWSDGVDWANIREHGDKHGVHGGNEGVQNDIDDAVLHKLGEKGDNESFWCWTDSDRPW